MEQSNIQVFGTYKAWLAGKNTWFINFMNGRQNMYLLEGRDRALLLDTGYGAGNLRSFVETLTSKPIIVVNTHFHRDHAGGNGEFEEVLMSAGALVDGPEWMDDKLAFDLSMLPHPDYKKTFLSDGELIDLGGRIIEVMEAKPAHCNSSLFYFDRTEGMVFCGDELEAEQVLMYIYTIKPIGTTPIRERLMNLRANTERLLSRSNEFEWLLPCHNGFPIDKSYMNDFIGLVDGIFSGEAVVEKKLGHPVIDKLPLASLISRVRFKKASFFMADKDLEVLYGRGGI